MNLHEFIPSYDGKKLKTQSTRLNNIFNSSGRHFWQNKCRRIIILNI
jgi:hypothetical protein